MRDITKATLAVVAGVVLLVAPETVFWAPTDAGHGANVVQSGTLALSPPSTRDWSVSKDTGTKAPFHPTRDTIDVGEVLSFTESVPVSFDGTNLTARFGAELVVRAAGRDPATTRLAAAVQEHSQVQIEQVTGLAEQRGVLTGKGSGLVTVRTDLAPPEGSASEYRRSFRSLTFDVRYTLTQVPVQEGAQN